MRCGLVTQKVGMTRVFNDAGIPLHRRGVTHCPGLYFLGLRGAHSLSSSLLTGVDRDAAFLAEHIAARQ